MKLEIKISEYQIQKSFFEWLGNYKRIRESTFAIPNGGTRDIVEATNLVRSGVTKGVPDVMIAIPFNQENGLFIEFKSKKGKLTKYQEDMINRLIGNGYSCSVCYSLEEAIKAVELYFGSDLRSIK